MSKFSDWLGAIGGALGFLTTLVLFIANLQNWVQDPNMLHNFSIAAFLLFTVGILWFSVRSSVAAIWRWASLVILYIFSALFFIWTGTWLTDSSGVLVEKGSFAPEQASAKVFRYQGVDDPTVGEGTGWFEVSTTLSNRTLETSYTLDYDIPLGSKGYAGIALWFANPQDFTDYDYVELRIKFADENGRCRFILKDSFGGYGDVVLGDGKVITASSDEQVVRIEIAKYFSHIALNSAREIDLDANGYFFDGVNTFTISRIRLIK